MKTDIVILSKTRTLVETSLGSIVKNVARKSIGKVIVGWTGDQMYESADICIKGVDASMVSLPHYNFAQNNNQLVDELCTSEAVLFMNDDVEIQREDPVTSCLEILEQDPKAGVVGIKLIYPQDGTVQHAGVQVSVKSDGSFHGVGHIGWRQDPLKWTGKCVVPAVTGAFMMARRADFLEVKGFDERYKCCFEDVDLAWRIKAKLHKLSIVNNDIYALHLESVTRKQAFCQEDIRLLRKSFNENFRMCR